MVAHVIVADPSWRADSARLNTIVRIDTLSASIVRVVWSDSVRGMREELGAAWPAVWRTASALLASVPSLDSVAVHVLAPAQGSTSYDGWTAWRATWPGRVTVATRSNTRDESAAALTQPLAQPLTQPMVQAGTPATNVEAARIVVQGGPPDDVVRAAFALHMPLSAIEAGVRSVFVQRSANSTNTIVTDRDGVIRVDWPTGGVPPRWIATRDTAGALVTNGVALIAPWIRTARAPAGQPGTVRVIARWGDGEPAAIERRVGTTSRCTREVGVGVPNGSDILLSASARSLMVALAASCGQPLSMIPSHILADSGGPRSLAAANALRAAYPLRDSVSPRWLPALLLGVAILLLALEMMFRRASDTTGVDAGPVVDSAIGTRMRVTPRVP